MAHDEMIERSATVVINTPPTEVFDAVSDMSRIGDRSPECVSCKWIDGADGPAVGAKFTGDNVAKLGPITLKKWTTTSEVTECTPGEVFEFNSEGYTTWRYEMRGSGDGSTEVTESCSFPHGEGLKGFLYERVLNRPKSIESGMRQTLGAIKAELEG